MIPTIKDLVLKNPKVTFHHYSSGELWYTHESGFLFPVPISDAGDAVFNAEEKALFFMRWMRKYIDLLNQEPIPAAETATTERETP